MQTQVLDVTNPWLTTNKLLNFVVVRERIRNGSHVQTENEEQNDFTEERYQALDEALTEFAKKHSDEIRRRNNKFKKRGGSFKEGNYSVNSFEMAGRLMVTLKDDVVDEYVSVIYLPDTPTSKTGNGFHAIGTHYKGALKMINFLTKLNEIKLVEDSEVTMVV